ncbi:MAG: aminoacetone oxidase family FAD-binding enzyme [Clostridia bacterium]|nr:aminoacetone oxidase family FAD-binding enzyme [Clostridia bacterium]
MGIWDAIFVGGGASGLIGSIMLKRQLPSARVLVLEKQSRVGKKLLSTGNGTCNLSNIHISPNYYHGDDSYFPDYVLTTFPPEHVRTFFESIGVLTEIRENGRIYPICASAAAVLDCILEEMKERKVSVETNACVTSIQRNGKDFLVKTATDEYLTSHIVVCTGGVASPSLGGCDDGYALLQAFGHKKNTVTPSIVQVKTDTQFVKAVKGLRLNANVSVRENQKEVSNSFGEVLFTEYGLSGPAVMQVSRAVGRWETKKQGKMEIALDLFTGNSEDWVYQTLKERKKRFPKRSLEEYLTGMLQKRIGQTVLRSRQIMPLSRECGSLTEKELKTIASTLKEWTFPVFGTKGFGGAQVTAGGILTKDFSPLTLESSCCPHLYALGEVLDVDGDCGGYNLHWAFASALAVSDAIRKDLEA